MNQSWAVAIETSGRKGSAAIGIGRDMLAEQAFATDTQHARDLLPVLQELFERQQASADRKIEYCYVSIGPGSFTGLRVAVTFARHLALAKGTRLVAVQTLDAIAMNALELPQSPDRLAVILDAKRKQVFGAVYEKNTSRTYVRIIDPCLIAPGELFARAGSPITLTGEGIAYHREAVHASGAEVLDENLWYPRAANVYRIGVEMAEGGQVTAPRELIPFYVRRPEVEEVWEKRQGPQ